MKVQSWSTVNMHNNKESKYLKTKYIHRTFREVQNKKKLL